MNLSEHFTLRELTKSNTASRLGIDNTPTDEALEQLKKLCTEVLEPIRVKYGKPIIVNSGYRSEKLNKAIGGAKTSQHMTGGAADVDASDGDNAKLFNLIKDMIESGELKVGQLIWEKGNKIQPDWVHVSIPYRKVNQILYLY